MPGEKSVGDLEGLSIEEILEKGREVRANKDLSDAKVKRWLDEYMDYLNNTKDTSALKIKKMALEMEKINIEAMKEDQKAFEFMKKVEEGPYSSELSRKMHKILYDF